jgi:predicted alpha/beta-hydrolase family hydrolase
VAGGASAEFREGAVRGFLDRPAGPFQDGLVLTHGAGGDSRMALLAALARVFASAGVCVLRCDLPFRQRRSHGPPSPSGAAADRAGLKDAVAAMRTLAPGRVYLGGQSYGGRQATMLAAEEPALASGLLLLSYPLHPPGKPESPRTAHFPALRTPAFFVHGKHDPFASTEELRTALGLIAAPVALAEIENARHDLMRGAFDVARLVVEPFLRFTTAPGR